MTKEAIEEIYDPTPESQEPTLQNSIISNDLIREMTIATANLPQTRLHTGIALANGIVSTTDKPRTLAKKIQTLETHVLPPAQLDIIRRAIIKAHFAFHIPLSPPNQDLETMVQSIQQRVKNFIPQVHFTLWDQETFANRANSLISQGIDCLYELSRRIQDKHANSSMFVHRDLLIRDINKFLNARKVSEELKQYFITIIQQAYLLISEDQELKAIAQEHLNTFRLKDHQEYLPHREANHNILGRYHALFIEKLRPHFPDPAPEKLNRLWKNLI